VTRVPSSAWYELSCIAALLLGFPVGCASQRVDHTWFLWLHSLMHNALYCNNGMNSRIIAT
jgi:hypothetical protein